MHRDMIRVRLQVGSVSEGTFVTQDMIRVILRVGSVSEGRFCTQKCTLIGAWAGTQRGLSRVFYTVCAGLNARENYAGMNSEQN